ncbi:DUF4861 family protein [Albibacterium bauzanense]|uniref:Uncharacterized protein DUF4861 n=1 Tax=Albibacterium bauzanense TaxID=653929 RepID=A0A4R1M2X7_9SPHI|nr:DUF4861 family protein [Albibacterium bauzanense]TCK85572.1 uncharacterized protein DUF4861 [Albibacterium bauzanense]
MKKISVLLFLLFGTVLVLSAQTNAVKASISISNSLDMERTDELVAISWTSILSKYPSIDTANFKVVNAANNQEVPFQLEHAGQKAIQNLLLQVSVAAKASIRLSVVAGKPEPIVSKTYGRYVPERYDDFAWENDKVAYRMYGKALETRPDNAFGIDVWVKRTNKLVINDWYKTADYHKDHGDGMDYYSVGLTLGAGDIAPYVMDSVYYSKNYHHWKVLDNGPLRTSFQLGYDAWDVAGKSISVVKTISLDAGSRFNKIQVVYSYNDGENLPVVIGIVKRNEPGAVMMDEQQGIMGYWEPEHGADGVTGVATIYPSGDVKMNTDRLHLLTHASVKANEPLVYYNGSIWSKANGASAGGSAKQWFTYVDSFNQKLKQPLKVIIQ